jgi:Tfp pilus assembly major pilin PilA
MKFNSNIIIIIIMTLGIAGGAYWYYSVQNGNQAPLTATAGDNATQEQFKTLVGQLQSISFNTAIFSDPRFTSLTDIATQVTPEPKGRPDPFAPFTGGTAAKQTAGQ